VEKSNKLEQKPDIVTEPKVVLQTQTQDKEIKTSDVTPVHNIGGGYVEFETKLYQKDALKELRPDLFAIKADTQYKSGTNFGTQFPKIATKGDTFVRVDVLPNRVFKFDGKVWIEQNKAMTQTYLYNNDYMQFLVEKIGSGEYDLDVLSDAEKAEVESYLKGNQKS
jgi:hypothetical protein